MLRAIVSSAVLFVSSATEAAQYGWSISASETDPHVHTGGVSVGIATLYLWYECNVEDGMSAAELGLSYSGVLPLAFQPLDGFINAGTITNPLLAVGGCPSGPIPAARILTYYNGTQPANVCIVPSSNGNRYTIDCAAVPTPWPIRAVGWDVASPPPCDETVPGGTLCGLGCHGDFCVNGVCQTIYCVICGTCPPCDANCPPVSVAPTAWGSVKSSYR